MGIRINKKIINTNKISITKTNTGLGRVTARTFYDPDVIRYLISTGIGIYGGSEDVLKERRNLNTFVLEMKRLNYWSTMVCWPLRQNQNTDDSLETQFSGSIDATFYSLGGLGSYPLTEVGFGYNNSFGWQADGAGEGQYLYVAGDTNLNNCRSIIWCGQSRCAGSYDETTDSLPFSLTSSTSIYFRIKFTDACQSVALQASRTTSPTSGPIVTAPTDNLQRYFIGFNLNAFNTSYFLNNSSVQTTAGLAGTRNATGSSILQICNSISNYYYDNNSQPTAFCLLATNLGGTALRNIYDIYKRTIGQGLLLP